MLFQKNALTDLYKKNGIFFLICWCFIIFFALYLNPLYFSVDIFCGCFRLIFQGLALNIYLALYSLSLSGSLSISLSLTVCLSLFLSLSHTHTHTHTHLSISLSLTVCLSLSLFLSLLLSVCLSLSHTHTHTLFPCLYFLVQKVFWWKAWSTDEPQWANHWTKNIYQFLQAFQSKTFSFYKLSQSGGINGLYLTQTFIN